ncbi:hypothetical protein FGO68_gene15735 [Halteria grandinella]|uniref:Uncharacterized protein n=1 Tax=Halteria grandinella TaxID=5974 RepID=A0A8J8NAA2_HALGN|nr:hypothetical protein FGO68_gene15735 [Halteria grandinella]
MQLQLSTDNLTSLFSLIYDDDIDIWYIQEIDTSTGLVVGTPFWIHLDSAYFSSSLKVKEVNGRDLVVFVGFEDYRDSLIVVLGQKDPSNVMQYQSYFTYTGSQTGSISSVLLDMRIISGSQVVILAYLVQWVKIIKFDISTLKATYRATLPHQSMPMSSGSFISDQYFYYSFQGKQLPSQIASPSSSSQTILRRPLKLWLLPQIQKSQQLLQVDLQARKNLYHQERHLCSLP